MPSTLGFRPEFELYQRLQKVLEGMPADIGQSDIFRRALEEKIERMERGEPLIIPMRKVE